MRRICLLVAVVLSFQTLSALGQARQVEEKRGFGYLFLGSGATIAEGTRLALMHFGGGGESLIKGGFGGSVELGYLFSVEGGIRGGLGVFAPAVSYRFRHKAKTVPFLTGGWALGFREDTINLIHFGGGVDHWLNKRLGLRIEARDFIDAKSPGYHFLQARIGLLMR